MEAINSQMTPPKSKRPRKSAAWPLKSCNSDTVFTFFGWKDDEVHRQRYKSLLDAGQQLWQATLDPLVDVNQDEVERDIVCQLMSHLQPLMSWQVGITRSDDWKPLCKHVAYWSRRRYLGSKAWRTLRSSQRRVSLRLLPTRIVNRPRRGERTRSKTDATARNAPASPKGPAAEEKQPQIRLRRSHSPSPWVADPVTHIGRPQVPAVTANAWVGLWSCVCSRRQAMDKCAWVHLAACMEADR